MEPIFSIKPPDRADSAGVFSIEPYRHNDAWVFDDERVGLVKEPFVSGIDVMIDRLTSAIPQANLGFLLRFSSMPFDGSQITLSWIRQDPVEGNWYRADDAGDEGWLCPAIFWYFASPPEKIYVAAEPKPTASTGSGPRSP